MKAYILQSDLVIAPFKAPLAAMKLAGETLAARLERQFRSLGLEPKIIVSPSEAPAGEARLIADLSAVCSEPLLRAVVEAARLNPGSFQVEVQIPDHEILSWPDKRIATALLPLYYLSPGDQATPPARSFASVSVVEIPVGLPSAVYGASQAEICFQPIFGRQIRNWVDYHLLANLVCRDHTTTQVRRLSRFLPARLIRWALGNPHVLRRTSRIGKNCEIHPTAILEGCYLEDGVVVGPYAYLKGCYVGKGATIREHSSIKLSHIGAGAFLMGCNLFNSLVGDDAFIVAEMLHNACIGDRTFIGGGTGFSDFNLSRQTVQVHLPDGRQDSGLKMLGSAVGEDCFLGAGLVFRPGLTIPYGTQVLSSQLIESAPRHPEALFVAKGNRLIRVPKSVLGEASP